MTAFVIVQLEHRVRDEVVGLKSPSTTGLQFMKTLKQHDAILLSSSRSAEERGRDVEYHTIEVPDMQRANSLAAALRKMDGVESAFTKPGEELP